jgi:hypothetical protein
LSWLIKVGNGGIDHSKMMRPEDMTASNMQRPAYKVTSARGGSDLAGSMVVAFAVGSMAFKNKGCFTFCLTYTSQLSKFKKNHQLKL